MPHGRGGVARALQPGEDPSSTRVAVGGIARQPCGAADGDLGDTVRASVQGLRASPAVRTTFVSRCPHRPLCTDHRSVTARWRLRTPRLTFPKCA